MTAEPKPERGPASKPLSLYPLKFEEIVKDVLTIKPTERAQAEAKDAHQGPMKARHVATLSLLGWYLMLCNSARSVEMMPTIGCHTVKGFDTAKECEEARSKAVLPTTPATVEDKRHQDTKQEFRCFASDDARLRPPD